MNRAIVLDLNGRKLYFPYDGSIVDKGENLMIRDTSEKGPAAICGGSNDINHLNIIVSDGGNVTVIGEIVG